MTNTRKPFQVMTVSMLPTDLSFYYAIKWIYILSTDLKNSP